MLTSEHCRELRSSLQQMSRPTYAKLPRKDALSNGEVTANATGRTIMGSHQAVTGQFEAATMKPICLTALIILGGCSSIIEGTSQEIVVSSNPAGADCNLTRNGMSIARINQTPGSTTVKKTKYDITVICNKPGYQEATYLNHSGTAGATVGNLILGGGIGWAIDSASGADNKYDSPVNITLPAATMPLAAAGPVS